MHDENGLVKRGNKPVPMRGPVACETSGGCPKGHWKNSPDLTDNEEMVIHLFNASLSSGGQMLTDGERQSDFLLEAFSELTTTKTMIEKVDRRREMLLLAKQMELRS